MIDRLKKLCNEWGIRLIDNEPNLPEGYGIICSLEYKMIILSKSVLDIDISACIDYFNGISVKGGAAI